MYPKKPDSNVLQLILDYFYIDNVEAGIIKWRKSGKNYKAGEKAGSYRNDGYLQLSIKRNIYLQHHVAWFIYHGEWPDKQVDHINGVKDDNSLSNLRLVGHSEQNQNHPRFKNNTSGITGVYFHIRDKKWWSQITINGDNKFLGYFKIKDEAITARKTAEKLYNFHPNHGRNNEDTCIYKTKTIKTCYKKKG